MASVLLINPSYSPSYGGAKGSIVNPIHPTLGLATIAATAIERGHDVHILDLSWRSYDPALVRDEVKRRKPDIVGITATTPLMNQLRDMSVLIKDISGDIRLVGGGAHPTALPAETLRESMLDVVLVGEADYSFADVVDGGDLGDIPGVWYRDGDGVAFSGPRTPIESLDDMPMPAWELYDTDDYLRKGMVRSFNWDHYFIYSDEPLFAHEHLDYANILDAMRRAYWRAILTNPRFIVRRIRRGIRTGEFFWNVYYWLKFILMPETTNTTTAYHARDRWPIHDFAADPPRPATYQIVRKPRAGRRAASISAG